jgi:hypothetical protein
MTIPHRLRQVPFSAAHFSGHRFGPSGWHATLKDEKEGAGALLRSDKMSSDRKARLFTRCARSIFDLPVQA